jgi:hypothetical protein
MQTSERIQKMVQSLRQMANGLASFVVFEDAQKLDNYTQVRDFTEGIPTVVEVTKRDYPSQRLQKLTQDQVDALANLGFSRATHPNHSGEFDCKDALHIASLCEKAFAILGSDPLFDLNIRMA